MKVADRAVERWDYFLGCHTTYLGIPVMGQKRSRQGAGHIQFLVQDFLHETLEISMSIFNRQSTKMAYWVIILPWNFTVLPASPVAVASIV